MCVYIYVSEYTHTYKSHIRWLIVISGGLIATLNCWWHYSIYDKMHTARLGVSICLSVRSPALGLKCMKMEKTRSPCQ